jgi:hypothetical protein
LHLLNVNDEVLAQNFDLMEQDQPVHPMCRPGDVEDGDRAPHRENKQQQNEPCKNPFFH